MNGHIEPRYPVMSQKEMLIKFVWQPFIEAFHGLTSPLVMWVAGIFSLTGLAGTAIGLVDTPATFYIMLLGMVFLDWAAGVIVAIKRGEFDIRVATRKWYHLAAYFFVCAASTLIANMVILELGRQSVAGTTAWYFQFVVYLTFAGKEFVSLLKTFRLIDLFIVSWEIMIKERLGIDSMRKFKNAVDDRYESERHQGNRNE